MSIKNNYSVFNDKIIMICLALNSKLILQYTHFQRYF